MGKQEDYDEIDKRIEEAITQKVEVPESFEKAMREALFSEKFYKRLRKRKIIRTITTACASVILTSGVAIGGFIAYEKIWKEPKQYTYEEFQNTIAKSDVSEEEKESLISEDEAKKNALEILNNLGYEGEEVQKIELDKNNEEMIGKIYYVIETNNNQGQQLNIRINAKNGNLEALKDNNILNNVVDMQNITEEEAINISNKICEDIKYENDEVEVSSCVESIQRREKEIKLWNTIFRKKYNKVVNPYEQLVIQFWVENNQLKISSIYTEDNGKYENNPMVITQEEAIKIAENKEKELTDNIIDNVDCALGIRKFNTNIYELEINNNVFNKNDLQSGEYIYTQEMVARNVWIVKIYHNTVQANNEIDVIKNSSKQYYIDTTTGEIIGGDYRI